MLDGSLPENDSAIYIEHVNGVHYDVVLDVDVQTTTPRKCSEVKRKCSDDDIGEKPRNIKKSKLQVARYIEEENCCLMFVEDVLGISKILKYFLFKTS